jgi:hypothetical protein
MEYRIEIKELCQSNNISKEHAELIIKEIQNAFTNVHTFIFEFILSFEGITGISLEASSIIRNYIFDNKLEKSICIINMTPYVKQMFFHNSKTSKEINENEMNNQKELSKFGKWFLNFMNNKGGAKILVMTGLTSLAIFLGPFFVQTFNLLFSDMNGASKAIVIFGLACVITAIVCLVKMIILVNKQTDFFK